MDTIRLGAFCARIRASFAGPRGDERILALGAFGSAGLLVVGGLVCR